MVILVEAQRKDTIAFHPTPFLLFLSIGTLLLGIGLLAFNLQILLGLFENDVVGQILSLQSSYYRILGLIAGLGMTIGVLIDLWRAFGVIFPD